MSGIGSIVAVLLLFVSWCHSSICFASNWSEAQGKNIPVEYSWLGMIFSFSDLKKQEGGGGENAIRTD